ncbi:hypothetical protein LIER_29995 [Lithospermum erythrorhizon]|uniref:Reverse transcriptase/retrotransposon-derived protein RNase H-like domain-containing protein n=1 Tax=Lithospermum erythrorhizon TaxID=34254 RepID=A0AAV3RS07_LITER
MRFKYESSDDSSEEEKKDKFYAIDLCPMDLYQTRSIELTHACQPSPNAKAYILPVKELKQLTKTLPTLKIPSSSKRILQRDVSNCFWGAVLLEEDEHDKRHICGYKSGAFKDSEKYYHSTYKEILLVKRGIENSEFHLIGQQFLIEMDMSSFPKML